MRVLINRESDVRGDDLDNEQLAAIYRPPRESWFRANMVSTVDGAATGDTGTTGSINNEPDKRVFDVLRRQADAVIVGAGTVRIEGYRPTDRPLVVVSRRGVLPPELVEGPRGSVLLATCAAAEGLEVTRDALGAENVLELGTVSVDLPTFKKALLDRGFTRLLTEGGPHLLRDLLAAGLVDELCATVVPRLVAGQHLRILEGISHDASLTLRVLLEQDSTLLGRWFT
jgi:riboflavin biosynthesis pyrimidine reductase